MSCFCLKDILCYRKEGRIPVTLISHIQFASEYDSSRVRKSLLFSQKTFLASCVRHQIGSGKGYFQEEDYLVIPLVLWSLMCHCWSFLSGKDSTKKLSKEKSKVRENCQRSFFFFPLGSWRRWQSLGLKSFLKTVRTYFFPRVNMIFFFSATYLCRISQLQ